MKEPKPKRLKYDLTQSLLYKITTKKQLVSRLNLSDEKELRRVLSLKTPYEKFYIEKDGKKPRLCEVPTLQLQYVHSRIFNLLQRVEVPDYLHSGVKGRSYISNAKAHLGSNEVLTLDIKKFYPSVSAVMIARFFRSTMCCAPDVAAILAKLCTCDGHIPTGSSLSQLLAYFACKSMFDEIHLNAADAGITMTCYVDDLTFSGMRITKKWAYEQVKRPIRRHGMSYHKERRYKSGDPKEITGVIVDHDTAKVCNRHLKKIFDLTAKIAASCSKDEIDQLHPKLLGNLSAAGQIDQGLKIHRQKVAAVIRSKRL